MNEYASTKPAKHRGGKSNDKAISSSHNIFQLVQVQDPAPVKASRNQRCGWKHGFWCGNVLFPELGGVSNGSLLKMSKFSLHRNVRDAAARQNLIVLEYHIGWRKP